MRRTRETTTRARRGKVFVGLWLDEKLLRKIDDLATTHGRSRSSMTRRILSFGVARPKAVAQ